MKTALITGASSGIGLELARIHASRGNDLVIVARRKKKLLDLKSELEKNYKVKVMVIVVDLSRQTAPEQIFSAIKSKNFFVEYLINDAGFSNYGFFHEIGLEKSMQMINVNILALTALTRLFLPEMVKRDQGKVLNIASGAGFMPGPLQAVYFATKAFVISFSQAIANELSDSKVTVTALCPRATKTEFIKKANLSKVNLFQKASSPHQVALLGYQAMLKGQSIVFSDRRTEFIINYVLPFLPRALVVKLTRRGLERK